MPLPISPTCLKILAALQIGSVGEKTRFNPDTLSKAQQEIWQALQGHFNNRPVGKNLAKVLLQMEFTAQMQAALVEQIEFSLKDAAFVKKIRSLLGDDAPSTNGLNEYKGAVFIVPSGEALPTRLELPVTFDLNVQFDPVLKYLLTIIQQNRMMQMPNMRFEGKPVFFDLLQAYVPLRTTRQHTTTLGGDWTSSTTGPVTPDAQLPMLRTQERFVTVTQSISVEQALGQSRRMVILGEPGSGKSTLLHYLGLLYACDLCMATPRVSHRLKIDEGGYFPILLTSDQAVAFFKNPPEDVAANPRLPMFIKVFLKEMKSAGIDLTQEMVEGYLRAGKAIIMLDGLGEVADGFLAQRVARMVEEIARVYPGCRYVITCRTSNYNRDSRLGMGFAFSILSSLAEKEIRTFLDLCHYALFAGRMKSETNIQPFIRQQSDLVMTEVRRCDTQNELYGSPLMLALSAIIYAAQTSVPQRRTEAFAVLVALSVGRLCELQQSWETTSADDVRLDNAQMMKVLQEIALYMHESHHVGIPIETLWRFLAEKFAEMLPTRRGVRRAVESLLEIIERRSGLLISIAPNVLAFSHLTLQEFLAGTAIAIRGDYLEFTLARVGRTWWREVILLEAGYLGSVDKKKANYLVSGIAEKQDMFEPYGNLTLASECVFYAGKNRYIASYVTRRLRALLETPVAQVEQRGSRQPFKDAIHLRSLAAEALARNGGIFWEETNGEPEWVEIPAGEFFMGDPSGDQDERPYHKINLDVFHMARVPVSNAQYAIFLRQANHNPPAFWDGYFPPRGKESHPVVSVTWYDAMDYCGWLSGVTGKRITLPSEAEWEKAAMGLSEVANQNSTSTANASAMNTLEMDINDTTSVGIFPDNASLYKILDLKGNIWEWTRSLWGHEPFTSRYRYPYMPDDGREEITAGPSTLRVLRGGSFFYQSRVSRTTYRYRNFPAHGYYDVGFRVVYLK